MRMGVFVRGKNDIVSRFALGKVATFAVMVVLFVLAWAILSSETVAKTISAIFALIFSARFVGLSRFFL